VTFYSQDTLALVGKRLGVAYHCLESSLHLFTDRSLSWPVRCLFRNGWLAGFLTRRAKKRRAALSLTWSDHLAAKAACDSASRPAVRLTWANPQSQSSSVK
jgi:hypothetical protein